MDIKWLYYTLDELAEIHSKKVTVERIVEIILGVLSRMPQPVYLVGGPITSGGRRSVEENRKRIHNVVLWLKGQGASAFNHLIPLKRVVHILHKELGKGELTKVQKDELQVLLWERFYLPILSSGMIYQLRLMPSWEFSSTCWRMREFALEKNRIKIGTLISEELVLMAEKFAGELAAAKKNRPLARKPAV